MSDAVEPPSAVASRIRRRLAARLGGPFVLCALVGSIAAHRTGFWADAAAGAFLTMGGVLFGWIVLVPATVETALTGILESEGRRPGERGAERRPLPERLEDWAGRYRYTIVLVGVGVGAVGMLVGLID